MRTKKCWIYWEIFIEMRPKLHIKSSKSTIRLYKPSITFKKTEFHLIYAIKEKNKAEKDSILSFYQSSGSNDFHFYFFFVIL